MTIKVAVVGATGETGSSIINGLLEAGDFSVIALSRPASVSSPRNASLKERGIQVVSADLSGPEDDLVSALHGIDIVVSAIGPHEKLAQIPLATAAKKAGVKRFLPCGFITVAPPGVITSLTDVNVNVLDHIKRIKLPYTYVDVGWWYQITYPRLPSGKIDYAASAMISTLVGDGNTPSAITDLCDIGKYVAKIIIDERTENKYVFAYNEVWTPNQVYELIEKLSGEKVDRAWTDEKQIKSQISTASETLQKDPKNVQAWFAKVGAEYQLSWGARGDNTPDNAKYLGYITSKELYPDVKFRTFETFLREVLDGEGKGVYRG